MIKFWGTYCAALYGSHFAGDIFPYGLNLLRSGLSGLEAGRCKIKF